MLCVYACVIFKQKVVDLRHMDTPLILAGFKFQEANTFYWHDETGFEVVLMVLVKASFTMNIAQV